MKRIHAPHKDQDGWRYVRVPSIIARQYPDDLPGSRMRTSRRAEADFETGDFLRLCAEERLCVTVGHYGSSERNRFSVFSARLDHPCFGPTLREAYYRYHAAVGE